MYLKVDLNTTEIEWKRKDPSEELQWKGRLLLARRSGREEEKRGKGEDGRRGKEVGEGRRLEV